MVRSSRRSVVAATTVVLVFTAMLSGCFRTTADFGNDAEKFIVENQGLRDTLRAQGRLDVAASFTSATCDEPHNQDEGTTFASTAIDSSGATWEFEGVVTGSNSYDVNLSRAPDGGSS